MCSRQTMSMSIDGGFSFGGSDGLFLGGFDPVVGGFGGGSDLGFGPTFGFGDGFSLGSLLWNFLGLSPWSGWNRGYAGLLFVPYISRNGMSVPSTGLTAYGGPANANTPQPNRWTDRHPTRDDLDVGGASDDPSKIVTDPKNHTSKIDDLKDKKFAWTDKQIEAARTVATRVAGVRHNNTKFNIGLSYGPKGEVRISGTPKKNETITADDLNKVRGAIASIKADGLKIHGFATDKVGGKKGGPEKLPVLPHTGRGYRIDAPSGTSITIHTDSADPSAEKRARSYLGRVTLQIIVQPNS